MISVGVTGGIGSGKTTFCNVFEELGAEVVYADELAREMMISDPDIKKQLIDTFGEETYRADGSLKKSHLIEEAFKKGRVSELNNIVHPALRRKTSELITEAKKNRKPLFVIEAAVLLNEGRPGHLDKIVLLKSDEDSRIKRVKKRDNVMAEDVSERIVRQPEFDKLDHLSDFVIVNDGTIQELKEKAKELFYHLIQIQDV